MARSAGSAAATGFPYLMLRPRGVTASGCGIPARSAATGRCLLQQAERSGVRKAALATTMPCTRTIGALSNGRTNARLFSTVPCTALTASRGC